MRALSSRRGRPGFGGARFPSHAPGHFSGAQPEGRGLLPPRHANFQLAGFDEEIVHALEMAYLNLLARYEIVWESARPNPGDIKVRGEVAIMS